MYLTMRFYTRCLFDSPLAKACTTSCPAWNAVLSTSITLLIFADTFVLVANEFYSICFPYEIAFLRRMLYFRTLFKKNLSSSDILKLLLTQISSKSTRNCRSDFSKYSNTLHVHFDIYNSVPIAVGETEAFRTT